MKPIWGPVGLFVNSLRSNIQKGPPLRAIQMDGVSKPGTKLHGHGKVSYFLGRQKVSKKLVAQRVIKGGLNGYFYNSPCELKQIKILFRLNRLL